MNKSLIPISKLANHIERRVERELADKRNKQPKPAKTLSAPVKEKLIDKGED